MEKKKKSNCSSKKTPSNQKDYVSRKENVTSKKHFPVFLTILHQVCSPSTKMDVINQPFSKAHRSDIKFTILDSYILIFLYSDILF